MLERDWHSSTSKILLSALRKTVPKTRAWRWRDLTLPVTELVAPAHCKTWDSFFIVQALKRPGCIFSAFTILASPPSFAPPRMSNLAARSGSRATATLYEILGGDKNREQSNLRGGIGCSVVPGSLGASSPAEPRGWDRPQSSTPIGAHLSTAQLPRSICAPTSICIYCTSGKAQADVGSRRDIGTNLDTSTM